ncbi:MAG: hypothetical protein GQ477_06120 [Nanohaloarchaea archaeon]|nr:hypothetical protein [Candidatus Nanohaloarchaea archaeon]
MSDWKNTILLTGIDKLLEVIGSEGSITLGEASRELNIKPSIIESWANALSEDKMITTSYNSQGELVLRSTKKNLKVKEGKIEELKTDVNRAVDSVGSNLDEEENMLKISKDHIRSFEHVLNSDINHIESFNKDLKAYDNKKNELIHLVKKLKSEESTLEKEIDKIEGREKKIKTESDKIKKIVDTKVIEISKSKEKILDIERSKTELKRDFEVLRRISNAIKKTHPEEIGPKIDDIEKRTKNLKTHNSLVKQKFEKLSDMMKTLFS